MVGSNSQPRAIPKPMLVEPDASALTTLETLLKVEIPCASSMIAGRFPTWYHAEEGHIVGIQLGYTHLEKLSDLRDSYKYDALMQLISASMFTFSHLTFLVLRDPAIHFWPLRYEEIVQNFPLLEHIDFSSCNLNRFPEPLIELPHLKKLYLPDNSIDTIPECIDKAKSLEYLYLVANDITDIPDTILELPRLKLLSLSGNNIDFGNDRIKHIIVTLRKRGCWVHDDVCLP